MAKKRKRNKPARRGVPEDREKWLKHFFDNAIREGVKVTGIIQPRKTPEGKQGGNDTVKQIGNSGKRSCQNHLQKTTPV